MIIVGGTYVLHFMFWVQRTASRSCFSPFTIGDSTQVGIPGNKHPYMMSHLPNLEPLSKQIAMILIPCHIHISFLFWDKILSSKDILCLNVGMIKYHIEQTFWSISCFLVCISHFSQLCVHIPDQKQLIGEFT